MLYSTNSQLLNQNFFWMTVVEVLGFLGVASGKEPTCQYRRHKVQSLGWEHPLEKEIATHLSILSWEYPRDRGAWWAIVHGVAKNWTTEVT